MVAPRLATGVLLLLFCRGPGRARMHVHAMSDAHYSIRAQHQHACMQCSTRGLGTAGAGMHLRLRDVSVRGSHSVDLGLRIVGSIGRPEHVLVYRCTFTTVHAHTLALATTTLVLDRLEYMCYPINPRSGRTAPRTHHHAPILFF